MFGLATFSQSPYSTLGSEPFTFNVSITEGGTLIDSSLLATYYNPDRSTATGYNDQFGYSVATSGNYTIVGAHQEDDADSLSSGKAYIYDNTTGTLLYTLDNPNINNSGSSDYFGRSVAISGNYAIVGASYERDAGGQNAGRAYIYNLTTLPTAPATISSADYVLDNPNPYGSSGSDYFGNSVAISGDYAIVGSYNKEDAGGNSSGKAYIYNLTTLPTAPATLTSSDYVLDNPNAYNTSASDNFGFSVAISGNYAIVGAYQEDDASGTGSGKAYIYNLTTLPTAPATISSADYVLDNPNVYGTSANDTFGRSVAISSNYAIVAARAEDDVGVTQSGKAYIYDLTTLPTAPATISSADYVLDNPTAYGTGSSDFFGESIAISGNYAIVSAYQEDEAGANYNSGKAYIYDLTTLPTAPATISSADYVLDNPNAYETPKYDYFGWSVAISSNYAIVGAYQEDGASGDSSGKAYIYDITTLPTAPATLTSSDYVLDNPNAYEGDVEPERFGENIRSYNQYTVVASASHYDNGDNGRLHVYDNTTTTLLYILEDDDWQLASQSEELNASENELALSDKYLIICLGNATYSPDKPGIVKIYDITNGTHLYTIDGPNGFGKACAIENEILVINQDSNYTYIFDLTTFPTAPDFTLTQADASYRITGTGSSGQHSVGIYNNLIFTAHANSTPEAIYVYDLTTFPTAPNLSLSYTTDYSYILQNPNIETSSSDDDIGRLRMDTADNKLFVSAHFEDYGGNAEGVVYVYDLTTLPTAPATLTTADYVVVPPNPGNSGGWFGGRFSYLDGLLAIGELTGASNVHICDTSKWPAPTGNNTILLPDLSISKPGSSNSFNAVSLIPNNRLYVGDSNAQGPYNTTNEGVLYEFDLLFDAKSSESALGEGIFASDITESGASTELQSAQALKISDITETGTSIELQSAQADFNPDITESGTSSESASVTGLFNVALTETGASTESILGEGIFASDITESGTVLELQSAQALKISDIIESITAIETNASTLIAVGLANELVTALESSTNTVVFIASRNELITAIESLIGNAISSIEETITSTETQSAQADFNPDITESGTAVESSFNTIVTNQFITELTSALESSDRTITVPRDVTENIITTDLQSAQADFAPVIEEIVTAVETITSQVDFRPVIEEIITALEIAVGNIITNQSILESITAIDSLDRYVIATRDLTELVATSDLQSAQADFNPVIEETGTASDAPIGNAIFRPVIEETGTVTESSFGTLVTNQFRTEALNAIDDATRVVIFDMYRKDGVFVVDQTTAQADFRPSMQETANALDTPIGNAIFRPVIEEIVSALDSSTRVIIANRDVTEVSLAIDSPDAVYITNKAVLEVVNTNDSVSAQADFNPVINESISLIDIPVATALFNSIRLESVTATDSPDRGVTAARSVLETITASDAATRYQDAYGYILEQLNAVDFLAEWMQQVMDYELISSGFSSGISTFDIEDTNIYADEIVVTYDV